MKDTRPIGERIADSAEKRMTMALRELKRVVYGSADASIDDDPLRRFEDPPAVARWRSARRTEYWTRRIRGWEE